MAKISSDAMQKAMDAAFGTSGFMRIYDKSGNEVAQMGVDFGSFDSKTVSGTAEASAGPRVKTADALLEDMNAVLLEELRLRDLQIKRLKQSQSFISRFRRHPKK